MILDIYPTEPYQADKTVMDQPIELSIEVQGQKISESTPWGIFLKFDKVVCLGCLNACFMIFTAKSLFKSILRGFKGQNWPK